MIGRLTLKFVLGMTRFLGLIRVHPFQWDKEGFQLITTSRKTSVFGFFRIDRLGVKISMCLILVHAIFGYSRIILSIAAKNLSFQQIMFQFFVIGFQSFSSMVTINNIRNVEDMANAFTILIRYERQLTGKHIFIF